MLFSSHNILLFIYTSHLYISANALPPTASPPPRDIAAPLNANNRSIDAFIGGNCHGSIWCSLYGGQFISTAYLLVTQGYPQGTNPGPPGWNSGPMNDTAFYAEGAHAVCIPIASSFGQAGFCVFAQDPPIGRGDRPGVTGRMMKWTLSRMLEMKCRMCGVVGSDEWGWITANYVTGPVCGGVCPEARYTAVESGVGISRLVDLKGGNGDGGSS